MNLKLIKNGLIFFFIILIILINYFYIFTLLNTLIAIYIIIISILLFFIHYDYGNKFQILKYITINSIIYIIISILISLLTQQLLHFLDVMSYPLGIISGMATYSILISLEIN